MNNRIGIVGVGLIGGSIALDLKKHGYQIFGVDKNPENIEKALELKLIDESSSLEDLAGLHLDTLFLSVPVNAIVNLLPNLLDINLNDTTIIDVGSTKSEICKSVNSHGNRSTFIAAHPIAGTENVGPEGSITDLFKDKQNIVCEWNLSGQEHQEKALKLFEKLGLHTLFMDPDEHDKHLAYVSHLSHISSFMLGQTVLDIEKSEINIKMLAGSGFDSTVRLAKSSPEMWGPIFQHNKKHVLDALNIYIDHLSNFRDLIESDNTEELKNSMKQANDIRRILK